MTKRDGRLLMPGSPAVYRIKAHGRLDGDRWSEWLGDMTLTVDENGDTILCGPLADQAALYDLLRKLRDLALPLLSVNRLDDIL